MMKHLMCIFRSCLALVILVTITQSLSGGNFSDDLRSVAGQNVEKLGREAKAAGFEKLLNDYPDHPKCAVVMLELSSLWELTIPNAGIQPDYSISIRWLKKAVESAPEGSEDWVRAQFLLSSRLFDIEKDPGASQSILREIQRLATDPITEIKVLLELQTFAVRSGRLDKAEEICMQIQSAADDPSRLPETLYDKGQIFGVQQASAELMMVTWLYLNIMREERLQKMENLVKLRPTQFNTALLERMRVQLESMKEMQQVKPGT